MSNTLFRVALFIILACIACKKGFAHERWANNEPVPPWVKLACCGPQDAHHLTSQQVHAMTDGWHVEGYPKPIPYASTLPSQDGDYWIFYLKTPQIDGSDWYSPVYCFFAPAQSY